MFTSYYKGYYINGHFNKDEVSIVFHLGSSVIKCKSVHSAKCIISKLNKGLK